MGVAERLRLEWDLQRVCTSPLPSCRSSRRRNNMQNSRRTIGYINTQWHSPYQPDRKLLFKFALDRACIKQPS